MCSINFLLSINFYFMKRFVFLIVIFFSNNVIAAGYDIFGIGIYDIKFDDSGYVYIATDLGISILETPYSKDVHPSNIAVSPNPFQINVDEALIVTNIPSPSTTKDCGERWEVVYQRRRAVIALVRLRMAAYIEYLRVFIRFS